MRTVTLPRSGALTTALGFGCAYLTGGFESRRSTQIVDAAFALGFRHFDVAPVYGIGTAENVLGAALAGRRSEVTIASKIGKARPHLTLKTQLVRLLATPVRRLAASRLRRRERVKSIPSSAHPPVRNDQFSLVRVQNSLKETLKRLRTDYLDILLLHEATLADISDELLSFLDRKREEGVIRAVGIASQYENVIAIAEAHRDFFDVLQHSWSPLDRLESTDFPTTFHITHRTLMRAYEPLRDWMAVNPVVASRLSAATDLDLTVGSMLSTVLLGAALAQNAGGIVLVGTRRKERIAANAEAMLDERFVVAGRAFLAALRRESELPATK